MMSVKVVVLIPILLLVMTSCEEDGSSMVDINAPSIKVEFPTNESFGRPGDTVFIRAVITDESKIRKGSVHIHDQFVESPFDTVFVYQFRVDERSLKLDTFWIPNSPFDKNYDIFLDATDYADNYRQKKLTIYVYH